MLGVAHGERRTALATENQAGQKMLGAVGAIERLTALIARHFGSHFLLPSLDAIP